MNKTRLEQMALAKEWAQALRYVHSQPLGYAVGDFVPAGPRQAIWDLEDLAAGLAYGDAKGWITA